MHPPKKRRKKGRENGFLIAAAICLLAIGGAAVVTFINSLPGEGERPRNRTTEPTAITTGKRVDQLISGVPDDRTTAATVRTTVTSPALLPATAAAEVNAPAPEPTAVDLYVLPMSNEVIKAFSDTRQVFSKTMNDWRVHPGVDFKGKNGDEIKAVADGEIIKIGKDPMWGDTIALDHGFGIVSTYRGAAPKQIKEGDTVKMGQVIGTLSAIPCESEDGPHLHLEISSDNKQIDPVAAIGVEVNSDQ